MTIKAVLEAIDPEEQQGIVGTLRRYRRIRRWMILTAALMVVIHQRWMDYDQIVSFLQVSNLPRWAVQQTLVLFSATLLFSGGVAARQFFLMSDRLVVQRRNAIVDQKLQETWESALKLPSEQLKHKIEITKQIGEAEEKGIIDKKMTNGASLREMYGKALEAADSRIVEIEARIATLRRDIDDNIGRAKRAAAFEAWIDVAAVAVPIAALCWALLFHGIPAALEPFIGTPLAVTQ